LIQGLALTSVCSRVPAKPTI